jgi:hypothetical protein
MLFTTCSDIWDTDDTVHKAAKRALYISIRHTHKSVDVLNEEDVTTNSTLNQYKTLYIVDPHVSSNATAHIVDWVNNGGTVYASGQAGFFDEAHSNNVAMMELLGLVAWTGSSVLPTTAVVSSTPAIGMLKRDLPTASQLDTVVVAGSGSDASMGAYGLLVRPGNFTGPAAGLVNTTVLAHFASDQTAAATLRKVGKGRAVFTGFLPSISYALDLFRWISLLLLPLILPAPYQYIHSVKSRTRRSSYFAPALPNRPIDICPRDGDDGCFCHFIPSAFDKHVFALLDLPPIDDESATGSHSVQ